MIFETFRRICFPKNLHELILKEINTFREPIGQQQPILNNSEQGARKSECASGKSEYATGKSE